MDKKIKYDHPESQENYCDFDLHISPEGHVLAKSVEGEEKADISLHISENLQSLLRDVETNNTVAGLFRQLGEMLYEWLFPANIHTHLKVTEALARSNKQRLRIRLNIEANEIAQLPLELLHPPDDSCFLAINPDTVLSRYINLGLPQGYVRTHAGPLHLLVIISNPIDLKNFYIEQWKEMIFSSLKQPLAEKLLTITIVDDATYGNIRDALLKQKPDIVHFIGHGWHGESAGWIALVNEKNGKFRLVKDADFADIFRGYNDHLGLVCLTACESAKSDAPQGFQGVAQQLVHLGTPAVLAMQYIVKMSITKIFFSEFYTCLAALKPVDFSVQMGRKEIGVYGKASRDFIAPVLYMRAKNGELFSAIDTSATHSENTPKKFVEKSVFTLVGKFKWWLIGIFTIVLFAFSALYFIQRNSSTKTFKTFTITSHQANSPVIRFDGGANKFSGSFSPTPRPAYNIYPFVKSPEDKYYPNKGVSFDDNGTWTAEIYFGDTAKSINGEQFEVCFYAVPDNSPLNDEISKAQVNGSSVEIKTGEEKLTSLNVTLQLPTGVRITVPVQNASVARTEIIRGTTKYPAMYHYLLISWKDEKYIEEITSFKNNSWSHTATFGGANTPRGAMYTLTAIAAKEKITNAYKIPEDAHYSNKINLIHK